MPHSVKIHTINTQEVVYAISIENSDIVYLTCKRTYALNEERAIVILDGQKFLSNWKNDPNSPAPELSKGTRENWIKDRKYHDADLGFQQGKNNPVPLAKIAFNESSKGSYISFTDGITRTIWLLANGVTVFPVECHVSEAKKLSLSAGINPGEYFIVADFLRG